MSDTYILLKDLPDLKAGAKYYIVADNIFYTPALGKGSLFSRQVVENSPEWFKKEICLIPATKFIIDTNNLSKEDLGIIKAISEKWLYGKELVIPSQAFIKEIWETEMKHCSKRDEKEEPQSVEERAYVQHPSEKKYSREDMEECFYQSRSVVAPNGDVFTISNQKFVDNFLLRHRSFSEYINPEK